MNQRQRKERHRSWYERIRKELNPDIPFEEEVEPANHHGDCGRHVYSIEAEAFSDWCDSLMIFVISRTFPFTGFFDLFELFSVSRRDIDVGDGKDYYH